MNSRRAPSACLPVGAGGFGYAERPSWPGWDDVEAQVPEAELHDLIIELRSLTMGLGTYRHEFHHLAEVHGNMANRLVAT